MARLRHNALVLFGSVVFASALTGCAREVRPPDTPGVCWLMTGSVEKPMFAPVAAYNANLYSCASQLEAVRMRRGVEVVGAYNGAFIFVTNEAIQTSERFTGNRGWVFSTQQRAELQRQLRDGLKADPELGTVRAPSQPGK